MRVAAALLLACGRTPLFEDGFSHDAASDHAVAADAHHDTEDSCSAATPRVLATFSGRRGIQLTVFGDYLYFTFDTTVARVHKCGGAIEELAKGAPEVTGVTTDGTTTYFTHGSPPRITAVTSGKPVTLATFTVDGPYFGIVLDGNTLFFPANAAGVSLIESIPTAGGTPAVLGPGGPAMAVHPGNVFTSSRGHIVAINRTTLAVSDVAPVIGDRIAVDATDLYFAGTQTVGMGYVARVPQKGGTIIQLATNLDVVGGIAVDTSSLYFVSGPLADQAHHLHSVPKEGGPLKVLAEAGRLSAVGLDDTSVFWMTNTTVMRLDK